MEHVPHILVSALTVRPLFILLRRKPVLSTPGLSTMVRSLDSPLSAIANVPVVVASTAYPSEFREGPVWLAPLSHLPRRFWGAENQIITPVLKRGPQ